MHRLVFYSGSLSGLYYKRAGDVIYDRKDFVPYDRNYYYASKALAEAILLEA